MPTVTIFKQMKGKNMAQIPQKELIESISELSKGELNLLLYYYTLNDGWVFNDKSTMKIIGAKNVRNVADYRRGLILKGYLLIQRGETDIFFIGKGAVSRFKKNIIEKEEEVSPKEPVTISKADK